MYSRFISEFDTPFAHTMWHSVTALAPIWIPILFLIVWFELWMDFKRRKWMNGKVGTTLEIKIPREMFKSPQAMELFLNTIYNPTTGNLIKVYIEGVLRSWFSLELVSIGGSVHFYIWCHNDYKRRVETQLYAQFPNIEVHEVPDYTLGVHADPAKYKFGWIGQLALIKPSSFPIKTYIDHGLDQDQKEEYKNDPLVSVLEFLGSLKKGEQAWIQIMIQAHTKEGIKYGRIFERPDWKKAVSADIKKFIKENAPAVEGKEKIPTVRDLTKGQQDVIAGIERTVGKNPFETMIRMMYFAEPSVYDPTNIGGLIGSMLQFNASAYNGFKPDFNAGSYEYPWQDFRGKKKRELEEGFLEAYKRRSFFNKPFRHYHGKPFIMTSEELATLWHFPSGTVAATPTLTRIPSKTAEAPSNLPV